MIQHLNKVELIGHVGRVSKQIIEGKTCAQISLATNYCYMGRDGTAVIETTWHEITAFGGKDNKGLDTIKKGDALHVVGRIRRTRFTDQNGNERTASDILASKTEAVSDDCGQPENIESL